MLASNMSQRSVRGGKGHNLRLLLCPNGPMCPNLHTEADFDNCKFLLLQTLGTSRDTTEWLF